MKYCVVFSHNAKMQLDALYEYIADSASPEIAEEFTDTIVSFCGSLQFFPFRGTNRNDIQLGLRIIHYKKRTQIAYYIDKDAKEVIIHSIFYGGQNYIINLRGDTGDF